MPPHEPDRGEYRIYRDKETPNVSGTTPCPTTDPRSWPRKRVECVRSPPQWTLGWYCDDRQAIRPSWAPFTRHLAASFIMSP